MSKIVNLKEVINQPAEPIEWLIQGVLAEGGVYILAGAPKDGKSFLTLTIAFSIATGTSFLGGDVKKGKVFIVNLEDGERRVQSRLKDIFRDHEEDASRVRFLCSPFKENIMKVLNEEFEKEPFDLAVVDPLILLLKSGNNENDNVLMGNFLQGFRDFAIKRSCTLLIVHHIRKPETKHRNNGLEWYSLRGASALASSADGWLLLERNKEKAKLKCSLRDAEGSEFELFWKNNPPRWVFGDSKWLILDFLRYIKKPCDFYEIKKETGLGRDNLRNYLQELTNEGKIIYHAGGGKGNFATWIYPQNFSKQFISPASGLGVNPPGEEEKNALKNEDQESLYAHQDLLNPDLSWNFRGTPLFKIGDYVQWECQNMFQFPEPQRIIDVKYNEKTGEYYYFFNCTSTGIPEKELRKIELTYQIPQVHEEVFEKLRRLGWSEEAVENLKSQIKPGDRLETPTRSAIYFISADGLNERWITEEECNGGK